MMKMIVIKKEVDCPFYHLQVIHTLKALSFIGQCDGELDMTCELTSSALVTTTKQRRSHVQYQERWGFSGPSPSLPRL